jgi:hypothetical protein
VAAVGASKGTEEARVAAVGGFIGEARCMGAVPSPRGIRGYLLILAVRMMKMTRGGGGLSVE